MCSRDGRARLDGREGRWLPRFRRRLGLAVTIPVEFLIFGLTLIGVAVLHRQALPIAAAGLATVLAYQGLFGEFPGGPGAPGLAAHFAHEWVTLVNLLFLLLGFRWSRVTSRRAACRPPCRNTCRTTGGVHSRCW